MTQPDRIRRAPDCRRIALWLKEATSAVAFTGAGISTESGIPDFRSPGGIWATSQPVYFDDFLASAAARHEYWRQKAATHRMFAESSPNLGHLALARWEQEGMLRAIITQNIDGLHQDAGSKEVLQLHGTNRFVDCLDCSAQFDAGPLVEQFLSESAVPACSQCGGLLKHATISFGQQLDQDVLRRCGELSHQADLFLAMGSSLVVEPAASLPRLAAGSGARLVIINRDATPLDRIADVIIHDSIGETLSAVDDCLRDLT